MSRLSYAKTNAVNPLASSSDYGRDIVAIINDIHQYITGASESTESGGLRVEPLGTPYIAQSLSVSSGSDTISSTLSAECKRISIKAVGTDIRFCIGDGCTPLHFISSGERLDFAISDTTTVTATSAGADSGSLEITELV
jgi:hypothetical protein